MLVGNDTGNVCSGPGERQQILGCNLPGRFYLFIFIGDAALKISSPTRCSQDPDHSEGVNAVIS